jgi:hypothetical protein
MSFPDTCEAMEMAGYRRRNYSRCDGCMAAVEWWITPTGQRIPMEHMPYPGSKAVSHWAVCPKEDQFRKKKEPRPCRPDDLQLQLISSAPPQSSVNNTKKEGSS